MRRDLERDAIGIMGAGAALLLCLYGLTLGLATPAAAEQTVEPAATVEKAGAPASAAALERLRRGAVGQMTPLEVLDDPIAAPTGVFVDAAGEPLDLSRFQGRVVLLNFWATWCPPCLHELPSLDRLEGALGGDDFVVVVVNTERRDPKALAAFLENRGIPFQNLAFYQDRANVLPLALGVRVMPTSVLIDRAGRVVATFAAPAEWDSAEAQALVSILVDDGAAMDEAERESPEADGDGAPLVD